MWCHLMKKKKKVAAAFSQQEARGWTVRFYERNKGTKYIACSNR